MMGSPKLFRLEKFALTNLSENDKYPTSINKRSSSPLFVVEDLFFEG